MAGHEPGASQGVTSGASHCAPSLMGWAAGTVLGVLIAAGASLAVTGSARQQAAPVRRPGPPTTRPSQSHKVGRRRPPPAPANQRQRTTRTLRAKAGMRTPASLLSAAAAACCLATPGQRIGRRGNGARALPMRLWVETLPWPASKRRGPANGHSQDARRDGFPTLAGAACAAVVARALARFSDYGR